MVFINNAIFDLPIKEILKGAYVQRNIGRRVCSNSKRKFPEDDSSKRIESLSIQALHSSSLFNICEKKNQGCAQAMISVFPSTLGRCLLIFCKQLRHVLCCASLCFPYFCPVAAIWCLLYYTLLAVLVN